MINHNTILSRIEKIDSTYDLLSIDCRYLSKVITLYPMVFPIYMRKGLYVTEFDVKSGQWKHRKGNEFKPVKLI